MPSNNAPVILCPLPRRSASYPYPLPHHRPHHLGPDHPLRHRSRRTPSISRTPSALSPTLIPLSPAVANEDVSPGPRHHTLQAQQQSEPAGLGSESESLDSKPPAEDDVLSEFLSLFIPSSPTITPATSPCAKSSPKHRKLPSYVNGHRPRSRLGLSQAEDGAIEDSRTHSAYAIPHTQLNWLIASPISRCHNPLPRHAELDALAARLADPIQGLVLTDRFSEDQNPEPPMTYFTRTLTGTEFKTQATEPLVHRLESPAPAMMA